MMTNQTTAPATMSVLKAPKDFYDTYEVNARFRERCMGGQPANKELIASWIKAKTGYDDDQTAEQIADAEAKRAEAERFAEELKDATYNLFLRDEHGLYIETRQVKALLRECFSVQRVFVEKSGSKQIFQHALFVDGLEHPSRIYLGREKADGVDEGPIHVNGPQGPRNALKASEYVENAEIAFRIRVLKTSLNDKRHIGQKMLEAVLYHAQDDGLGADRSQGAGKFDVTKFEKV